MNDRYRPSEEQIEIIYKCAICGAETNMPSQYVPPSCCGELMAEIGELYPADSREWDEERYPNGEWGRRSDDTLRRRGAGDG